MSISRWNLILVAAVLPAAAATSLAGEAELLATLKSGEAHKAKADACRELARVGTKRAVPALTALLGDEKLAHMARYALESIADPSVNVALRDAAGTLKGRLLVGVIGSLGVRRDAQAVGMMTGLLDHRDVEVARAAARALGNIASPAAVEALQNALPKAPADRQRAVCEALLRCAETRAAQGRTEQAGEIYAQLRGLRDAPNAVRTAALRGVLITGGPNAPALLREALHDKQYVLFASATRASIEMPAPAVTAALADELGKLPADRQLLVAQTLGIRGDEKAGPALLAAARKGPAAVRIAAIRALTRLGHAPAVAVLTEIALGDEKEVADEAQRCLANFPGKEGQGAVLALLDQKDPKARRLAIEMIGRRAVGTTSPVLLKAARDDDADVRAAALRVLRDTARAEDLSALLGLLVAARSPADVRAAEDALRALTAREARTGGGKVVIRKAVYGDLPDGKSADVTKKVTRLVRNGATSVEASNSHFGDPVQGKPKKLRVDFTINGVARSVTVAEKQTVTFAGKTAPPAFVEAFCAALPKAPAAAKPALLRILRSAGGPVALQAVRGAVDSSDAKVAEAAFRALCEWPTADALPAVAELARSGKTPVRKVLALRAYIRLAAQQIAPPATQVASLQAALALAGRDDERRLVLSALGNIPSAEALAAILPFVANPSLKEEACIAAVAVAEKMKTTPQAVAQAMGEVARQTANKKLAARAKALARKGT